MQSMGQRRATSERQVRLESFERCLGHGRRESIGVGRVTQIANTVHL